MDKKRENKTCQINIRMTPSELESVKKIAAKAGYRSVSKFLLDAAFSYNEKMGPRKIQYLDAWYQAWDDQREYLSRFAANLNQLAKYENTLSLAGVLNPDAVKDNTIIRQELSEFIRDFRDRVKSYISTI